MPSARRTRHVAALLISAAVVLPGCRAGDGTAARPATTTRSPEQARVARMRDIPCGRLAPPGRIGAAIGREVAPAGGASPAGTCVVAPTDGDGEFVVVAVSGPVRRADVVRQAPQGVPIEGLGAAARWDTAIPVGGRLLVAERGVEVGVVLQLRADERDALRPAAVEIARGVLRQIPAG